MREVTLTINTSALQNVGQLFSPGALVGLGIVAVFLFLGWCLASWGDKTNGRPQTYNDKQGYGFLIIVIIAIGAATVFFAGQTTGHTELITGPVTSSLWG